MAGLQSFQNAIVSLKKSNSTMWFIAIGVAILTHFLHFAGFSTLHLKRPLASIPFFMATALLYIVVLHWISPSNLCNTFTLLLIALLFFARNLTFSSWLSRLGWPVFVLSFVGSLIWGPPSYDNIGITELIDLSTAPLGLFLCLLYSALHFLSWVVSRKFSACYCVFAAYSLASVINLSKLISNLVSLSLRIEDQFGFRLSKVIFAAYFVSWVIYYYAISSFLKYPVSAIGMSLFYFVTASVTISSATILWGDPIMLSPIGVAGFLSSSILQVIAVALICFGSLSNKLHSEFSPAFRI
jgi:hypothetical protein